jgi:hypothetical protein
MTGAGSGWDLPGDEGQRPSLFNAGRLAVAVGVSCGIWAAFVMAVLFFLR